MSSASAAAAIILTGGASTRMGTDKASLVVDGASMLDRVRFVVSNAGIRDTVVAGPEDVPDPATGETGPHGPMAGIVSGWQHLKRTAEITPDPVVVLSCDLPAITSHVVEQLLNRCFESSTGAVAHDGERPQPLIAAYRSAALEEFTRAYEQGERSVRKCFTDWDLVVVPFDKALLADADTPRDLRDFDVRWPDRPTSNDAC